MDPTKGDSGKADDRTPHGVRIDKQREVRLPGAAEDFEKKRAAFRRQKRAAGEEDDSLFVRSDDDLDELSPPASTQSTPVVDASGAVEQSPPDSQRVHDRKRAKPNQRQRRNGDMDDCTCAISHSCERARRLDVRECRSLAPAPRRPKAKKEGVSKKLVLASRRHGKNQRTFQELTGFMATFRKITEGKPEERPKHLASLRRDLNKLPFLELPSDSENSPQLARFLHDNTGLPLLYNSSFLPDHVKLDSESLHYRWSKGDLEHNLLRGVEIRSKIRGGTTRALEQDYKFKISSEFVGEGHLRIGQWFPYQICALRDGAHGDLEAGISGRVGLGAFSIVLSSSGRSNTYADIDEGEKIAYCGTRSKDGDKSPTAGTTLLLQSANTKKPIRVLRSSKLPKQNKFRPAEGLRYDGLYEITDKELLDEDTAMYRFTLVRLKGQPPIRYTGEGKRPTDREIEEIKSVKSLMKQSI